jgi:hypothetical protein
MCPALPGLDDMPMMAAERGRIRVSTIVVITGDLVVEG